MTFEHEYENKHAILCYYRSKTLAQLETTVCFLYKTEHEFEIRFRRNFISYHVFLVLFIIYFLRKKNLITFQIFIDYFLTVKFSKNKTNDTLEEISVNGDIINSFIITT